MEKLTNKEEEIMKILWRLKKAFVKEIMDEITKNKPHYNTLSTIVRNLEEKNFVGFTAYGKTHQGKKPCFSLIDSFFLVDLYSLHYSHYYI